MPRFVRRYVLPAALALGLAGGALAGAVAVHAPAAHVHAVAVVTPSPDMYHHG